MANQNTPQPASGSVPLPRAKRGLKTYFAEVGRELKKVTWPSKQETTRLTGVVIVICIGAIILLLVLSEVFKALLSTLTKGF